MNKEAIYIHVPWCRRRCPYCDFYFVVGKPAENFVSALIDEYSHRAPLWLKEPAQSLYFGGGTPSLLPANHVARLIDHFRQVGSLLADAEITLEANPEDLNEAKLDELRNAGINRLSLGIQSLDDEILKRLGRKHSRTDALNAIDYAQKAGFDNISVDLIIGVPNEDVEHL